jgi:hypothetical protein
MRRRLRWLLSVVDASSVQRAIAEELWVGGILPPSAGDIGFPTLAVLAMPANGQELYRLLRKDVPRERDFMSHFERSLDVPEGGMPPVPLQRGDPFIDWTAVSMFATEE